MTVYGKIAGVKRKEASALVMPARSTSKSMVYPLHIAGSKTPATNGSSTRISNVDSVS
jgi:hypothetical protein